MSFTSVGLLLDENTETTCCVTVDTVDVLKCDDLDLDPFKGFDCDLDRDRDLDRDLDLVTGMLLLIVVK